MVLIHPQAVVVPLYGIGSPASIRRKISSSLIRMRFESVSQVGHFVPSVHLTVDTSSESEGRMPKSVSRRLAPRSFTRTNWQSVKLHSASVAKDKSVSTKLQSMNSHLPTLADSSEQLSKVQERKAQPSTRKQLKFESRIVMEVSETPLRAGRGSSARRSHENSTGVLQLLVILMITSGSTSSLSLL